LELFCNFQFQCNYKTTFNSWPCAGMKTFLKNSLVMESYHCRLFTLCIPKGIQSWTFQMKLRKCVLNLDRETNVCVLFAVWFAHEVASDYAKPYNVFALFLLFLKTPNTKRRKKGIFTGWVNKAFGCFVLFLWFSI